MNTAISTVTHAEARTGSDTRKYLFVLMLLFAASGCSALIYEVVWYQLLQLAIGSTSVSLGILLATFMGGLCIGSLWVPRMRTQMHPLKLYAILEVGIGIFAAFVQLSLPYLNRAYISGAEHGLPGMLLRGILAAICMLPPTILMGGSLPAITRWIEGSREGVSWWGYLYGGNTAGAVFGSLIAGFYLLRFFNMATATYVAVAINLAVAGLSLLVAGATPFSAGLEKGEENAAATREGGSRPWQVYVTIALSGATALGAEVVWTRTMAMLLLATVYVFAIILAVFLTGLAIGSALGSWVQKKMNAAAALGWAQILLTLGIAWTAYTMIHSLPWWNDDVLSTQDGWRMYSLDLKRCFYAILPATIFWGASFPLACAAVARPDEDSGRVTGGIYAANTLGGIVGALAVSLSLIPWIGSQHTEQLLLIVSALSGLLVLYPFARKSMATAVSVLIALGAVGLLTRTVPQLPTQLVAYGRFMASWANESTDLKMVEGRNSSVAYTRWNDGAIYVNVNGHVEATTEQADMKLQRMVGHLPAVLHPNPQKILGIGFGAGVSAGTFTRYPNVKSITICEIEPVVPPNSTYYFGKQNYDVKDDPRTKIVYDDARHFLLTTTDKYDIIASDPLDVFVKGTAALYSKEYFDVVKQHLNPGGYFTLYVPLYETSEDTIKSELLTFFQAFPYGTIWANNRDGAGYDMVFLGQAEPLKIDVDAAQQRLMRPDWDKVRASLVDIDVHSLPDLLSVYTGNAEDLDPWIRGAQVNHDGDLRLSYLAGWGINSQLADALYRDMLMYRHDPTWMTGSQAEIDDVIKAIRAGAVE